VCDSSDCDWEFWVEEENEEYEEEVEAEVEVQLLTKLTEEESSKLSPMDEVRRLPEINKLRISFEKIYHFTTILFEIRMRI
jgi:hypothetical protein